MFFYIFLENFIYKHYKYNIPPPPFPRSSFSDVLILSLIIIDKYKHTYIQPSEFI